MATVFDITDWVGTSNPLNPVYYRKNSIVKYEDYFRYALVAHEASSTFIEDQDLNRWSGIRQDERGITMPYFFWTPSYNISIPMEPKINYIQFGDGYIQRSKKQINNNLLNISLIFDKRNEDEFAAITHFLMAREGEESFLFVPPQPFAKLKKFICLKWVPNINFYDNNSVSAEFLEVPV